MSESTSATTPLPLEIDRIQSSRSAVGETRLRLSGHWLGPHAEHEHDQGLLVVHVEGRRHRFAADAGDAAQAAAAEPGSWNASFTVPSWAEPRQEGQAALWLGSAVIPVPPLHGSAAPAPAQAPELPPAQAPEAPTESPPRPPRPKSRAVQQPPPPLAEATAPPPSASPPAQGPPYPPAPTPEAPHSAPTRDAPRSAPTHETPRSGPLADLLLRETVAALHAELERRTADATRLRGALASAQSELETRAVRYAELEKTLGELRTELEALRQAVEIQRRELRQLNADTVGLRERLAAAEASADLHATEGNALRAELATANVSREAAVSEAAGLRAELERVGSELAVTHERLGSETGDLGEASRLLADAKALAAELRSDRG